MLHSKKNNQNLKREKEAPKQITLVFLFFALSGTEVHTALL
ncbi:hypothetical protein S3E15_00117 [Bacillus mycoides]|uniref:Uncharacterized protein n=1 Tax=Bacillus mycoides TaxID=1405 RepID=A0AAP7WDS4_BACMY|nr:hypothetical protein bmyco0001_28570 [Bacillus mycoides DSM 2048]KUH42655.1 hypothetical protein M2E15_2751 [Bacillus mycoides]OSX88214.1 hypothetical protein BTJ44_03892 [Bacillus mycoides]OSX96486.1 hypothetical protein S3E15_00117 [Bacillus mycoides]OSY09485.1 hypothetical protein S2E19_02047 [Bacillus mycoides]